MLVGPYETAGAHVCFGGGPPAWDFESELIAPELDRLMPWLERAGERLPLFAEAGLKSVVSGAITHTPDGNYPARSGAWCARLLDGIAAHRSASARAPAPANISRSGWCTARPKSTCANSIRAASASGQAATMRRLPPSTTITTCITATGPASSMRRAGRCAGRACSSVSARPARSSSRSWAGSVRAGTTKAVRASAFPSAAAIGGRRCARNAWRCATRSGSWTCRASPNSSSGAPARMRCCRVSAPTAFPAATAASCSPIC